MAFAALSDVNTHLPLDKAMAQDGDIVDLGIDADRLIRARIATVVSSTTIATWVSPDTTPELIREISGKLIAAKFYANLVAEDEADGSAFAQQLYQQAIDALNELRDGTLTLIGVDGLPIDTDVISGTSFWPNDTTEGPFFKIADAWS